MMGEDRGSWLPRQQFGWQSHNWNSPNAPSGMGQQNTVSARMYPGSNMVPANENFPACALTELPSQGIGQANEPHGWFYCMPQFRQAFTPVSVPTLKDKLPGVLTENSLEAPPPNAGSMCAEKRFLVFDQSGDQTTLIFSSGIAKPLQFPTWSQKFHGACNLNGEIPGTKSDINHPSELILTGKFNENHDTDERSEMHEDTEELNALLYSDDESDYTEDDEVTSTGHSPGSVTDQCKSDWLEGSSEEVASCNVPTRKRKICDEDHSGSPSLENTASSGCRKRSSEYDDDAQSSCAGAKSPCSEDDKDPTSRNKRMRKEKIKETVNILQRIVPSGKGKDATVVLDEAIQYLKSLKLKAVALGLGTL